MPKFGRPSVAAFAALHPPGATDEPPASDVATSASMRVAAPLPFCAGIMESLSARACTCGAEPPFQVWPSVALAGDAASALSVLAAGTLLRIDDVCLPDTVALAP